MNSYPVHFLAHHRPLLFVAGLDAPPPGPSPVSADGFVPPTTCIPADASAPSCSPASSRRRSSVGLSDDPFVQLAQRLRSTLTAHGQSTVWQQQGKDTKKDFHVVLVDKDIRLPPAKVTPPPPSSSTATSASTAAASATPRSPLSPYTPGSPLFPDGLIAPIWVRKHTDLLPAVFVLFLRLSEADDVETNKMRDDELVKELLGRKKVLAERQIKLTVVLIASRDLLDDPSLDPRLSQIRRQSSLDSRASLFVLTPVTPAELHDFVRSLQDVLYEPAIEYYQAHSKRVRRKRARLGPSASGVGGGGGGGGTAGRGLGREGWIVRYEYKAACFAEIRGEMEVARKHYEDCWTELSLLFHSTSTLPPRTKRWAEAKVLADCVAIKVCKLHLYQNDTARALAFFRRHLKKFEELSRGWGIGEETFEFWSWVARQYRIFAELLELGLASGLVLPVPSAPRAPPPALNQPATDFLDPALVLQHPGFYFEAAACCSVRRKETFQAALDAETDAQNSEAGSTSGYVSTSPGFATEKKVDHSALIVELFTKAYELLKKSSSTSSPGSSRVTLYIAFRIAEAYHGGGQYDMALRFFDRISKTYRREKWGTISDRIRELWIDCARKEGKKEEVVRVLVEMIGAGTTSVSTPDPQAELLALLQESPPSAPQPLVFRATELPALLDCSASFWLESAVAGQPVPFQVALASSSTGRSLDRLPFQSIRVDLDGQPPITVTHDSSIEASPLQLVQLGYETTGSGCLRWRKGDVVVLSGVVASPSASEIKVNSVTAVIAEGDWRIELVFDPNVDDRPSRSRGRWLTGRGVDSFVSLDRPEPYCTRVVPKPHVLDVSVLESSPAYVEESFPVTIDVRNDDSRAMDVWIDVLLYPTEDQSANTITIDDETSSSIIKHVSLGTLQPSERSSRTVFLRAEGEPGDRTLDLSVQSRLHKPSSSSPSLPADETRSPASSEEDDASSPPKEETIRTVTIPCVRPIRVAFALERHPPKEPRVELLDLAAFEEDAFEKEGEVVLTAKFELIGAWDLEVESVEWHVGETRHARSTFSSLDAGAAFPQVWKSGDSFAIVSAFDVASTASADDDDRPLSDLRAGGGGTSPGWYDIAWRRSSSPASHPLSHTLVPLPFLASPAVGTPTADDALLATLTISPADLRILEPFSVELTIHNLSPHDLAASLQLQIESSDAFAWAGPRQVRLPLLLAGQSKVVMMQAVGLKVGWSRLPRVRVWELIAPEETQPSGEVMTREVRVGTTGGGKEERDDEGKGMRVFVLPG